MLNILLVVSANAETENECFETVSRGIFKFNQGFDSIILEPVAKVYNKLPEPVKNGTGNLMRLYFIYDSMGSFLTLAFVYTSLFLRTIQCPGPNSSLSDFIRLCLFGPENFFA